MKLKIYEKGNPEPVYFCNTTGDPYTPDTVEDGGSKAGVMRADMDKWKKDVFSVTGDYLRASAALTLYGDTHDVIIEDLPDEPELEPDPRLERFFQE